MEAGTVADAAGGDFFVNDAGKTAKVRVRFAPSPTGLLHVGNARTALVNWLFARQKNGVFILRVEDTDVERSDPAYEERLIADLRWLGLDWEEGPDKGGEFGPYRQSRRLAIYASCTQKLLEENKAYYCFCSPEELEKAREKAVAEGEMPVYRGPCRTLGSEEGRRRHEAGEPATVRLRTPGGGSIRFDDLVRGALSFDSGLVGDPVLVRSTGLPAYNYAVVIDDALMRVSHVIRGEDHISNTPRQLLTYKALGFDPPRFAHLPMVMGPDNMRLSKRHGATSVDQFGRNGILSTALFNYLALLGWAPPDGQEVLRKEELIELFDLEKMSRSAAVFDYGKLHWINRQHMMRLSGEEQSRHAYPHLKQAGLLPEGMTEAHWDWLAKAVEAVIERVDRFADLPRVLSVFFDFSPRQMDEEAREVLKDPCAYRVIKLFAEKIAETDVFDYQVFAEFAQQIKQESGCKGKQLFKPLRVALTASASGLDLEKFIPLVEEAARLDLPKPVKSCARRFSETLAFLTSC